LEMKVVPEYLVWQGDETKNWNDDSMWKRASRTELKCTSTSAYIDNSENGTDNGFVPMLFSNVVMPANSKAQLYMAGFSDGTWSGDGSGSWISAEEPDNNRPSGMDPPSENVMYDLMTYGSGDDSNTPFTTERYRVNLCNQIHLSTGAQLLYSELLLYQKAHVEVSVPQSNWTLVSLPLNDIVAGDWYIKGQETEEGSELFTDLTFSSDNDSRYNPLVYQRSWNSEDDAVIVIEDADNITVPIYASTGWSSVYNDTYSQFKKGIGYSIKAYTPGGSSSGSSLVFRFPKADDSYDYSSNSFSRTDAGKLFVSDLVNRSIIGGYKEDTPADGVYKGSEITVPVTTTADGEYYCLIGNPFTAPMSMTAFFDKNDIEHDGSLNGSYWLNSAYEYKAESGKRDFTSEGTSTYLLQPYEAVFVKTNNATSTTIYFTKDMQAFDEPKNIVAFSIRAENANGKSSAAFTYSDTASDGYDADEDAILLKDATLQSSSMPLVYTVAGDKAVSINTLNSQKTIPLGVFVDDNSTYTLTFVGVDNVIEPTLYDAYTNTKTAITEGYSIEIAGATHGRYYINSLGKASTGILDTSEQSYGMNAYSPSSRTVTVSSDAEINTVEIYSINGALEKRVNVGGNYSCSIDGINCSIAIIKANTKEGIFIRKLKIKD
ncbi:MAG: T9SS type A sorting domain-containing protein, partial [Prevotella sp.]|nr:T9SS type A sorting domain-containing protein [Prevotella sp.]